jgi:hypothetical protein
MDRYLLVYPQGDVDRVEVLSIEGFPDLSNPPRVGPDGDVDTTAVVVLPNREIRTVLTLDLIDLNEPWDDGLTPDWTDPSWADAGAQRTFEAENDL